MARGFPHQTRLQPFHPGPDRPACRAGDEGASGSGSAAAPPPSLSVPPALTWEGADESQPTTSIQLRLADGSRMVAKFNLSHTVGDIRRWGRRVPVPAPVWAASCSSVMSPKVHLGLHSLPQDPWPTLRFCRVRCCPTRARFSIGEKQLVELHRFIHASRPEMHQAYRLVTAFPAQQLDDDSATIQAAGLANSVIIQKA